MILPQPLAVNGGEETERERIPQMDVCYRSGTADDRGRPPLNRGLTLGETGPGGVAHLPDLFQGVDPERKEPPHGQNDGHSLSKCKARRGPVAGESGEGVMW